MFTVRLKHQKERWDSSSEDQSLATARPSYLQGVPQSLQHRDTRGLPHQGWLPQLGLNVPPRDRCGVLGRIDPDSQQCQPGHLEQGGRKTSDTLSRRVIQLPTPGPHHLIQQGSHRTISKPKSHTHTTAEDKIPKS